MSRSVGTHRDQWLHNRSFLEQIGPRFPDWFVIVAFYTALHAIDMLLETDGLRPTSHETRRAYLRGHNKYKAVWSAYYPLDSLGHTMRYMANRTTWVPWDQIEQRVLNELLYPIEKSVLNLTKTTEDTPPKVKVHA